ncbi:hypothetical protein [Roseibium aggregatum]|uniref:Uncharacterized protein n=1 Tax=Roseibium aggregatum TaxID=187304 RepID=A0A939J3N5_9HYPH|nr:hypothetical protein [Roseibium aggregatum]MBN9670320.1 hypothetical protein [Roseibium aggregatum]
MIHRESDLQVLRIGKIDEKRRRNCSGLQQGVFAKIAANYEVSEYRFYK